MLTIYTMNHVINHFDKIKNHFFIICAGHTIYTANKKMKLLRVGDLTIRQKGKN